MTDATPMHGVISSFAPQSNYAAPPPPLPLPPPQQQQHHQFQSFGAIPPVSTVGPNQVFAALSNLPQQQQLAHIGQLQALAGIQTSSQYTNGHNGQHVSPALSAMQFAPQASAMPAPQAVQVPMNGNVTAPAANSNMLANLLALSMNQAGAANSGAPPAQVQMLQQFIQHLKPEQIAGVIAALSGSNLQAPPPPVGVPPAPPFGHGFGAPPPQGGLLHMPNGVESGRYEAEHIPLPRPRSRSPDFNKRRRQSPPDRRGSPTYAAYDPSGANNESSRAADYDRRGGKGKGRANRNDRNEARRTPPHTQRNRPTSPKSMARSALPKPVDFDPTLSSGFIKGDKIRLDVNIYANLTQS